MTGGDIAGLIAAGVFAILVALLAVPILRLTKVFDELIVTIRSLNQSTNPLIEEVTKTVVSTNEQLEKMDDITSNVSDASANVSALSSLVTSTVGQPLIKVASFSAAQPTPRTRKPPAPRNLNRVVKTSGYFTLSSTSRCRRSCRLPRLQACRLRQSKPVQCLPH